MTEPAMEVGWLEGLYALLDNRQMPDDATPKVTLGDLRWLRREAVLAYSEALRAKIEGWMGLMAYTQDDTGWDSALSRVLAALKEAAK